MPIRIRLALLFALGTALAVAIAGIVLVDELSGGLRSSLVASLQAQASDIMPNPRLVADLYDSDDPSLAQLVSASGHVLDGSGPGSHSRLLGRAELARAQGEQVVVERRVPGMGSPFLLYATAVSDSTKTVVLVGSSLSSIDQAVDGVERGFTIGGGLGVAVAGLAAFLLAGAALSPVERMRRQASEISASARNSTLVVPRSRDEVASLARTLNDLLERLQGALDRQRRFVSAAGHELRTPLAVLSGELELARKPGRSVAELKTAVDEAAVETAYLARLTEDLLLLSSHDEGTPVVSPVVQDVVAVLERVPTVFAASADSRGVRFALDLPESLVACVDGDRLRQVVDNVVANALRFAPLDSSVEVRLVAEDSKVMIEVADEGPGFPADFLPRAFERFSRSDESRDRARGGTGLGLAIVKSLVEAHGGQVEAMNRPQGGALVRIVLPAMTTRDG
ncbi:MAG: sensor histidine kinase [Acidimicrobiales bacterium]